MWSRGISRSWAALECGGILVDISKTPSQVGTPKKQERGRAGDCWPDKESNSDPWGILSSLVHPSNDTRWLGINCCQNLTPEDDSSTGMQDYGTAPLVSRTPLGSCLSSPQCSEELSSVRCAVRCIVSQDKAKFGIARRSARLTLLARKSLLRTFHVGQLWQALPCSQPEDYLERPANIISQCSAAPMAPRTATRRHSQVDDFDSLGRRGGLPGMIHPQRRCQSPIVAAVWIR
ncbi:uncharacterized protein B0I36DRAFT_155493 [Microdochium trichocladiopsis]|uniref:Uncharacterized protein n=1 Tax=Microdochium trichocladiopsis TaxID=1682393 RepID=A0A9P8Y0E9_9PEZI|nr:uncharacterized protein B0I36DRAFT_155493 [Microdochium trichocladiopsis]KAH7026225.1 hypothetical protein B0I36DRAFT_155493 [Microdochium trichocladiopsis]